MGPACRQPGLTVTDRDLAQKRQVVSNAACTLIAGQSLLLESARYSGSGMALSLGDLTFRLTNDFINSGLFLANSGLTVETGGRLTNQGSLQAGDLLRLNANVLDNTASGLISARQVEINAGSQLDNRGLIDGEVTRINLGIGRIYGDHLSIAATTLNNTLEGGVAATGCGIYWKDSKDERSQFVKDQTSILRSSGCSSAHYCWV